MSRRYPPPARRWPPGPGLLVLGLALAATSGSSAQVACSTAAEGLRAALAAADLAAARQAHATVWREPSCDDAFRDRAGRAVSLLHARVAQERVAAGAALAAQRDLLERGLAYGRTWPVLALLGDAARAGGDHDAASGRYQEALVVIDDPARTPRPPPVADIRRIFERAGQSRLLAGDYRASPRTRAGAPGGLAAAAIRGFVVERVPVPVTFHTGTSAFTEPGRRAALDLAGFLKAQNPAAIVIAGHTDPRGSEAYNLDLSQRRAEAVRQFLREQGFTGQVDVVAKGERERFPVDDPAAYTREQRWQMDRRVELIR